MTHDEFVSSLTQQARRGKGAGRRRLVASVLALRRGRVALPRDRRRVWELTLADHVAAALCPTFTPFSLFTFLDVQRRSRRSATLTRAAPFLHNCSKTNSLQGSIYFGQATL